MTEYTSQQQEEAFVSYVTQLSDAMMQAGSYEDPFSQAVYLGWVLEHHENAEQALNQFKAENPEKYTSLKERIQQESSALPFALRELANAILERSPAYQLVLKIVGSQNGT